MENRQERTDNEKLTDNGNQQEDNGKLTTGK